jgi:hypothetical protein
MNKQPSSTNSPIGKGRSISINIPTPCHEDWEKMKPVDKGRFCQSCAKQVVDFSMMTDQEVFNYFLKATGPTCGRFVKTQLEKPLRPVKHLKKKTWWIAAIMPALLIFKKTEAQKKDAAVNIIKLNEEIMGFGEVVIKRGGGASDYWHVADDGAATNTEPVNNYKPVYNTILTVQRKKGDEQFTITGKIISNQNDYPVSFATVILNGSKTATLTDVGGNFLLKGSTTNNHAVLTISSVGFKNADVYIRIKDTTEKKVEQYTVKGQVVDRDSATPVAYASIMLTGYRIGVAANEQGNFSMTFNAKNVASAIVVTAVGYEATEQPLYLTDSVNTIDLGTVKCKARDMSPQMSGVVVYSVVHKNTDTLPAFIRKVFHAEKFKTFPNPAQRGSSINIDVKKEGSYAIQLFDNNGNLITAKQFEAAGGATQTTLNISSYINAGYYYVRLVDEKTKKQYTNKIVVM